MYFFHNRGFAREGNLVKHEMNFHGVGGNNITDDDREVGTVDTDEEEFDEEDLDGLIDDE